MLSKSGISNFPRDKASSTEQPSEERNSSADSSILVQSVGEGTSRGKQKRIPTIHTLLLPKIQVVSFPPPQLCAEVMELPDARHEDDSHLTVEPNSESACILVLRSIRRTLHGRGSTIILAVLAGNRGVTPSGKTIIDNQRVGSMRRAGVDVDAPATCGCCCCCCCPC